MAAIRPFRALRPSAERAKQVASLPYDVVSTEEARALAANNPLSFLHVSRPEIDLPDGTDIYSPPVYRQALNNFESLKQTCPFEMDQTPGVYLYRLRMGDHEQIGVAACCSLDEYDNNIIRKHERTRRDKEDDRTRHILALRAQTGPVLLTYRALGEIDALVMQTAATNSLNDFTSDDGIQHTIWRVADPEPFVRAFRQVAYLYIADGHHRAASASRARVELKHEIRAPAVDQECDFFLAVIFPSNQLQILPYNRVVRDLNGLTKEEFLAKIRTDFVVSEDENPQPRAPGSWSMYLDGRWYVLTLPAEAPKPEGMLASLDVSIIQDRLLEPILGIKNIQTDKRIDFVGGLRGVKELERLVNEREAAVAFSLHPTTVDQLLRVADAAEMMPPKSTWFEPKLRDGLLIHTI